MNGSNQHSPKYFGSPARNQYMGARQPLYLQPNIYNPRGSRLSSPRNNIGSPDFIPLGISSPVGRGRHSWKNPNYSNNSYTSSSSTPPSSNSSFNSPYRRNSYRGNFNRGRGKFNNGGSGSPHISLYISKDMLEDPWAELEEKLKKSHNYEESNTVDDSEKTHNSTVLEGSEGNSENDNLS